MLADERYRIEEDGFGMKNVDLQEVKIKREFGRWREECWLKDY